MAANITLNQIAYNILESVRGKIKDDENISLRQIKEMVNDARALLLRRKFAKDPWRIDDIYVQEFTAEIEEIDSSEVAAVASGKSMYRTVLEIPSTVDRSGSEGTLLRVGPADSLNERYTLISHERALWAGNGKFNADSIFTFIKNRKVYVISKTGTYSEGVKYIAVRGVFENPTEVAQFKDSDGESFYSDDDQYPVSSTLVGAIEEMVVKMLIQTKVQAEQDNVNDGTNQEGEEK